MQTLETLRNDTFHEESGEREDLDVLMRALGAGESSDEPRGKRRKMATTALKPISLDEEKSLWTETGFSKDYKRPWKPGVTRGRPPASWLTLLAGKGLRRS